MKGLVGGEMVTETWLCMEVLALLPSEYWGSSVSMTRDWFTIENVEISLRRVFGDRSKKEVPMPTDKRRPVSINVVKKSFGKKRNQDEASATGNDECFYCFNTGHRKADCPVKTKDRDPNRHGGPLFRTNIRTLPGAKKKRLMAVKKAQKPEPAARIATSSNAKSPIDDLLFDREVKEELRDADELMFTDKVPASEGDESINNAMDIDDEVKGRCSQYLAMLDNLTVTADLWGVDAGAGHAVSPDKRSFIQINLHVRIRAQGCID